MKTILLLRHAKSSWAGVGKADHERTLSRRGEAAAETMARHIAREVARPGLVLCSTAARTRQTLAPVIKALGVPAPPIILEQELYLAPEDTLLERLRRLPESLEVVLLVGHNEGIGELACSLAADGPAGLLALLREKYPTGALATLLPPAGPWSGLAPMTCTLSAFVRPRDLDRG